MGEKTQNSMFAAIYMNNCKRYIELTPRRDGLFVVSIWQTEMGKPIFKKYCLKIGVMHVSTQESVVVSPSVTLRSLKTL